MRTIFLLWLFPIVFFWGWHFLSVYDVGGVFFLTQDFNNHIYGLYGSILQMPADDVPWALAWVFFIDSVILFFGVAIIAWWKSWFYPLMNFVRTKILRLPPKFPNAKSAKENLATAKPVGPVHPAE